MRTAPAYIQLYPTIRCNRSCSFCFNRALPKAKDMDFADFRRMLDKLKSNGVGTVDIIGGEPTLHEELDRLLMYSLQEGININLSSNGSNRLRLASIMDKYPQVIVGVSINDQKAARDLEELIITHRPVVKMVAGRLINAALVERVLVLKPRKFYLLYRDALDPAQLRETVPSDQFWRFVEDTYDPEQVGTVSCSGFLPDDQHYPELLEARCPAGTTKLGIMPDGSVYPCNLFFGREEFLLGNIFTDPFEEIWQHRSLTFFRRFSGNTCPRTSCILHNKCHGGCPAHSYAHFGKHSAAEPRCVPG